MATLWELFKRDGSTNFTAHQEWPLSDVDGNTLGKITARLHLDFEARAKFVSFYIPDIPDAALLEALALSELNALLDTTKTHIQIDAGFLGELKNGNDLVFTGQIYLYSERPVPPEHQAILQSEAAKKGRTLTFRSKTYATERSRFEKPRAFICHDSRDKLSIAEPIALELQRMMTPVWYDEYSLNVGDSLRQSIEIGLKECERCILVLTPNFLGNEGWTKREYDSIFTREIVEKRNLILPIWHDVDPRSVYKFSPVLADRVGVSWALGCEEVARRLLRSMNAAKPN